MDLRVQLLVSHGRSRTSKHHFYLSAPHSRALALLADSPG